MKFPAHPFCALCSLLLLALAGCERSLPATTGAASAAAAADDPYAEARAEFERRRHLEQEASAP